MTAVQAPAPWRLGRWLGLLAGLAATSWLLRLEADGPLLLLAGPVLGLALLAAVLVGALAGPVPAPGPARRAVLETRRVADYLPPAARPVAVLLGAYGLVTLAALARPTAAPPMIAGTCGVGLPLALPWPDPFVLVPAFLVVLLGLAVAAAGLRRLADRPRPAGVPVEVDDEVRREDGTAVVAACAVLVAGPLTATALVTGVGLVAGCGGPVAALTGWLLIGLAAAAAVAAVLALVVLLRPRRRVSA